MDKDEYIVIAGKVADGIASESEIALYNAYFNQYQLKYSKWNSLQERQRQEMLNEVEKGIRTQLNIRPFSKTIRLWPRIGAAAGIIIALSAGLYFYISRNPSFNQYSEIAYGNDINPGKNAATLTLGNGKVIQLSEDKSGIVVEASKLNYNDGTQVDAKSAASSLSGKNGGFESNKMTLNTPRGGTYQVTLPDGTRVWLNAASSLTYTTNFINNGVRSVKMSGEAYFEVSKDKEHPFIVESIDQKVEVLGTHFNVNAYEDGVATTLVEGSVKVVMLSFQQKPGQKAPSQKSIILKPGEQSMGKVDRLNVYQADVATVMAWKNGNFLFKEEKLTSIMKKLAYWYDVDVVYQSKQPNVVISGSIKRDRKLSFVLNMLELTANVKFKIEGRTVYVMN